MRFKRLVLALFLILAGFLLPTVDDSLALSDAGHDANEGTALGYSVPRPLESQLSNDGKTLRYGVPPVVYVNDPNPPEQPLRVPLSLALGDLPKSATANFRITYVPNGGADKWGEPCYKFPEEAKPAFNAAASVWASVVGSSVPITIRACWASLSGSTLGYSGGGTIHRNFTNAPRTNTWYSASLANSFAGYDLDTDNADMHITYNKNFSWHFGTDGNTTSDKHDFMTVVLHEIGHGLNFSGSMGYSEGQGHWGSKGYPNIYDTFVKDGGGNSLINTSVYGNPSTALGGALTSDDLWFHGSKAMAANGGSPVKIYAPPTWASGSSYSHLDYNTFADTVNRLMVYAIAAGDSIHDPGPITKGLLKDLGWGTATLIAPSGTVTTTQPTYSWNAVSSSSWYYLWVDGPSGNVIKKWYTAADANCGAGTGTCSVAPTTDLAAGNHTWWIQTRDASGEGPWSSGKGFTVVLGPPAATLMSPSGTIGTAQPTYSWEAVSNATWYYLWVDGPFGNVIRQWYTATQANCSSGTGTCSVTPGTTLAKDSHTWWIQTWNPNGSGLWSAGKSFAVILGPAATTLISPSGTIDMAKLTYSWNAVSNSTWYFLWVEGPSGSVIQQWYRAAEANCGAGSGTCSVTPDKSLVFGNYTWWIQTYNARGEGPWSTAKDFTVNTSAGGFDSGFNRNFDGWVGRTGSWSVTSSALTAPGSPGKFVTAYFQPEQFSNFNYRARIWRSGADSNSSYLLVRGNPTNLDAEDDWQTAYEFDITRNGYFSVWKGVNGSWTALKSWTFSSAIFQGKSWNELQVWMNGNDLWFAINGVWVFNIADNTLTSGYVGVGFYTAASSTGSQLWLDWARLTPLGESSVEAAGKMVISHEQGELSAVAKGEASGGGDRRQAPH